MYGSTSCTRKIRVCLKFKLIKYRIWSSYRARHGPTNSDRWRSEAPMKMPWPETQTPNRTTVGRLGRLSSCWNLHRPAPWCSWASQRLLWSISFYARRRRWLPYHAITPQQRKTIQFLFTQVNSRKNCHIFACLKWIIPYYTKKLAVSMQTMMINHSSRRFPIAHFLSNWGWSIKVGLPH